MIVRAEISVPAAAAPPRPDEPTVNPISLLLIVLGLIMIAFTLGRALRRRRAAALRASEETLEAARAISPAQGGAAAPRVQETCEEMVATLVQTAREVNAQLDTKISTLEVLIRQADERIAALAGGAALERPRERKPADDPRHAPVYSLSDEGLSALEIAQQTGLGQGEVEFILNLRDGGTPG